MDENLDDVADLTARLAVSPRNVELAADGGGAVGRGRAGVAGGLLVQGYDGHPVGSVGVTNLTFCVEAVT